MIWQYLREKLTWLLLLVFIQLITLFVAYMDTSIPFEALAYIVLLQVVICIVFIWARYPKETRYYKKLTTWDHT